MELGVLGTVVEVIYLVLVNPEDLGSQLTVATWSHAQELLSTSSTPTNTAGCPRAPRSIFESWTASAPRRAASFGSHSRSPASENDMVKNLDVLV